MLRRSHFALIKASFEQSGIILPPELQRPQARHEQGMVNAISGMIAEGRRAATRPQPKRDARVSGTVH
jgi:hypothetical protein